MVDPKKDDAGPRLLSGGNPQIPKGEGDGPVQAYIAAMPGWKSDVGRRLDELVTSTVPDVRKAVAACPTRASRSRLSNLPNGRWLQPTICAWVTVFSRRIRVRQA